MEYVDPGLVIVTMESGEVWLYDIYTGCWILEASGAIKTHTIGGNRKNVEDKFLIVTLENGQEYLFDPYEREIVHLKDGFGVRDYNSRKSFKSRVSDSVISGYDRVSSMYE